MQLTPIYEIHSKFQVIVNESTSRATTLRPVTSRKIEAHKTNFKLNHSFYWWTTSTSTSHKTV